MLYYYKNTAKLDVPPILKAALEGNENMEYLQNSCLTLFPVYSITLLKKMHSCVRKHLETQYNQPYQ